MADSTRDSFLAKRGVSVVTANLTFNGIGGIDPAVVDGHLMPILFQRVDASASLTGKVIPVCGGNTTNSGFIVPRAGSVMGLAVKLSTAVLAGASGSWWVTINGTTQSTTKITQIPSSNPRSGFVSLAKGAIALVAGDQVGLKLTTNSTWAASLDAAATVLVEV